MQNREIDSRRLAIICDSVSMKHELQELLNILKNRNYEPRICLSLLKLLKRELKL